MISEAFLSSTEHDLLCDWLIFHKINPCLIPIYSSIIVDFERHTITYNSAMRDGQGNLVIEDANVVFKKFVEQGEAGPLPFPEGMERT